MASTEPQFPLLCDTCLGPNQNIRMGRRENGAACKVCERPFTVYRWNPGGSKYKKTEICYTCAKIKDCCQSCLFDLKYNLPIQVRDKFMDNAQDAIKVPQSAENQAKLAQKVENRQAVADAIDSLYNKPDSAKMNTNAVLERLNRRDNNDRTKARICSFWLRGACERGDLCPFRHENPHNDTRVAKQDIKSRYFGAGDALAEKMIEKAEKMIATHGSKENLSKTFSLPSPPEDIEIKALYIDLNPIFAPKDANLIGKYDKGNVLEHLRDKFSPFGNPTIRVVAREKLPNSTDTDASNADDFKAPSSFAIISFETRGQAENAISTIFQGFSLFNEEITCRINWSKKAQTVTEQKQSIIHQNHQSVPAPMTSINLASYQQQQQQEQQQQMMLMAMMLQHQQYLHQQQQLPLEQNQQQERQNQFTPPPPPPPPPPPSS